jgi:hypothetical protein
LTGRPNWQDESQPRFTAWYWQLHQWGWLLVAALTFASGVVLLVERHRRAELEAACVAADADLARAKADNEHALAIRRQFEDRLEQNRKQRDEMVANIDEVDRELDLLRQKTRNVKQAAEMLNQLTAANDAFMEAKRAFDADVAKLEAAPPAAPAAGAR